MNGTLSILVAELDYAANDWRFFGLEENESFATTLFECKLLNEIETLTLHVSVVLD